MSGPKHFCFILSVCSKNHWKQNWKCSWFIFLRNFYLYFYRINELRLPMFVSKIYRDMDIIVVHYFGILVRRLPVSATF